MLKDAQEITQDQFLTAAEELNIPNRDALWEAISKEKAIRNRVDCCLKAESPGVMKKFRIFKPAVIAKLLGLKEQAVHYQISKLKKMTNNELKVWSCYFIVNSGPWRSTQSF